jgi:hypothetical protein
MPYSKHDQHEHWIIVKSLVGVLCLVCLYDCTSRSQIVVGVKFSVQWPRGRRRGSAAVRLLGLRVRIPPEAWIFVCCGCCVLPGRGLCDGPIPRPEESYRLWCVLMVVIVKPLERGKPRPENGSKSATWKKNRNVQLRNIIIMNYVWGSAYWYCFIGERSFCAYTYRGPQVFRECK